MSLEFDSKNYAKLSDGEITALICYYSHKKIIIGRMFINSPVCEYYAQGKINRECYKDMQTKRRDYADALCTFLTHLETELARRSDKNEQYKTFKMV